MGSRPVRIGSDQADRLKDLDGVRAYVVLCASGELLRAH
jgi:hypothetical protein